MAAGAGSGRGSGGDADEVRTFGDVAQVVVARLDELGWTRGELAARTGLNAASLRRLLTSPSANPTFSTMMALTNALGLKLEVREAKPARQMSDAAAHDAASD